MLVARYVVMWNVIGLGTFDHVHGELSELGACQLSGQIGSCSYGLEAFLPTTHLMH